MKFGFSFLELTYFQMPPKAKLVRNKKKTLDETTDDIDEIDDSEEGNEGDISEVASFIADDSVSEEENGGRTVNYREINEDLNLRQEYEDR